MIPEYFDILGDEVFVSVKSLEPFMSYNSESKIIEFSEVPSEGEYSVTIILRDASGHSTEN